MILENGDLLYELGRADITIQSKRTKKELCLFDLLENETNDFCFNDCENIHSFQNQLKVLHCNFKADLKRIILLDQNEQLSLIDRINHRMGELQVLLNPKYDSFLYSRLRLQKHPKFYSEEENLKQLHLKCSQYFGIQREVHRMSKNSYKVFLKKNSLTNKQVKGKKKKNKAQLELPIQEFRKLNWDLQPVKLIELLAALSQMNAFGRNITKKEVYAYFQKEFDVSLKNAESSLHQMKYRNDSPVRFLDELKQAFLEMMN